MTGVDPPSQSKWLMAQILKSQFNFFRVFDIGAEINLSLAGKILESKTEASAFGLKRSSSSVLIQNPPVRLSLGNWDYQAHGYNLKIEGVGKLWNYGALSLNLKIFVSQKMAINDFFDLAKKIEGDEGLHKICQDKATELIDLLGPSISKPSLWSQYEDYLIIRPEEIDLQGKTLSELIATTQFASIVLMERNEYLSEQMQEMLLKSLLQYGPNDFVLIHWNAAVVYDNQDGQDIADVIEFAICQLLEMRYYDHRLDFELAELYDGLEVNPGPFKGNKYSRFSHKAAITYLEINEITEKVENSLKIIGDFYYAQIFRLAMERFRIKDWENSIDSKLRNLAEISKLFQGEAHQRQNIWLEIIIVVLIAVEVVPLILKIFF